jgi:hypothetical protein
MSKPHLALTTAAFLTVRDETDGENPHPSQTAATAAEQP